MPKEKSRESISLGVPPIIWSEMMYLVLRAMPNEISGLASVEINDKGAPFITNLHILKQKNTPSGTVMDTADMAKFLSKEKEPEKLKVWWHSHGRAGCFWSSTDRETIELLRGVGEWLFSIVVNGAGEYLARLDMMSPLLIDNMPVTLLTSEFLTDARRKELDELFDACATEPEVGRITLDRLITELEEPDSFKLRSEQ